MTLLNVTVYTTLVYVASPSPLNHFAQPMSNPQHFFLPKITFISTSLNGCPSANQSATGKRCPQALSNGPLCLARFWDKGTLHLFHHVGRQLCLYTRLFFNPSPKYLTDFALELDSLPPQLFINKFRLLATPSVSSQSSLHLLLPKQLLDGSALSIPF